MHRLFDKVLFRLRVEQGWLYALRSAYWRILGAGIEGGTKMGRLSVTWPHQVRIGSRCVFEDDVSLKFDGYWKPGPSLIFGDRVFVGRGSEFNIRLKITIGDDCLIASGCKFIDHDHGMAVGGVPMNQQPGPEAEIHLGPDVWLGVNAVVLKGVTISRGAIVAAGSIVTKSIGENEIWAGVPAKRIGSRLNRGAVPASMA